MSFKTTTSEKDATKIPVVTALSDFSKVATQYGTAFSDASCFTKEMMEPLELPAGRSVLDVFGLCFDDGMPMLNDYHSKRGDTNQSLEAWRPASDSAPFCGQRQFTCTTLVRAMMNKPYEFIEYQRYAIFKMNNALTLAVQFSSQVPRVMFGDAFRAESLAVFTESGSGDDTKVTMRAYGYVQFLRGVLVKGKINSTSLNQELPESYKIMSDIIMKTLSQKSEPVAIATAPPVEDSPPSQPVPEEPAKCIVKPQTVERRQMLVYGTLATIICVCFTSCKGLVQVLFLSSDTNSLMYYRYSLIVIYLLALSGSIGVGARVLALL